MKSLFPCFVVGLVALSTLTAASTCGKCNLEKDCQEKGANDISVKSCISDFCDHFLQHAEAVYGNCMEVNRMVCKPTMSDYNACNVIKLRLLERRPKACKKKDNPKVIPRKSCHDIHISNTSAETGLYWIQADGDIAPVRALCDMSYAGGGWTLASYGYVHTAAPNKVDPKNQNIPNMNHPYGFNWDPTDRAGKNGLIALEHGAVNLARGAQLMIMAAGNNPNDGGIDRYSHVYEIDIKGKDKHKHLRTITFANHGHYRGAAGMHIEAYNVYVLKKGVRRLVSTRYALAEALGVSAPNSLPTGYGFSDSYTLKYEWRKGPFFPSFHSGDGHPISYLCGGREHSYAPDIKNSCPFYTNNGWYSFEGGGLTGQMSIWFK